MNHWHKTPRLEFLTCVEIKSFLGKYRTDGSEKHLFREVFQSSICQNFCFAFVRIFASKKSMQMFAYLISEVLYNNCQVCISTARKVASHADVLRLVTRSSPRTSAQLSDLYSPRNDPDPEMIPNPEMIPKSTPKWSQPRNDPHVSCCRPRNDPQGIMEWWLDMGLWIAQ